MIVDLTEAQLVLIREGLSLLRDSAWPTLSDIADDLFPDVDADERQLELVKVLDSLQADVAGALER